MKHKLSINVIRGEAHDQLTLFMNGANVGTLRMLRGEADVFLRMIDGFDWSECEVKVVPRYTDPGGPPEDIGFANVIDELRGMQEESWSRR